MPKKLTDKDKKEILTLYRNTNETTSTLAESYGVSSSSVSRFLKKTLTEEEYDKLIAQKRQTRRHKGAAAQEAVGANVTTKAIDRTTSSEAAKVKSDLPTTWTQPQAIPNRELESIEVKSLEEMLGENLGENYDTEDELDDLEIDEELEQSSFTAPILKDKNAVVQILPLQKATLPQSCYLVVSRQSELIARPLKEFSDLGKIPTDSSEQLTLPVFDNHRVAKRFSNRFQRVVKVPDSRMLARTHSYLTAKGITNLLFDGQVFSLPSI